jgi:PKHD-type hydroxylase
MLLVMKDVLSVDDCNKVIDRMNAQRFEPGTKTAGWHAKLVKNNEQLDRSHPDYMPLNKLVTEAIMRNPTFRMGFRPKVTTPLLFSRYHDGMEYGTHVDDPLMYNLRSDVSFTLFLADPASYDGGELVMETTGGEAKYKLNRGEMIAYSSNTLHRVNPVTRGDRLCAVGWAQSHVRDPAQREILYELDLARRAIFDREKKTREFDLISKAHANLMRMWAEV